MVDVCGPYTLAKDLLASGISCWATCVLACDNADDGAAQVTDKDAVAVGALHCGEYRLLAEGKFLTFPAFFIENPAFDFPRVSFATLLLFGGNAGLFERLELSCSVIIGFWLVIVSVLLDRYVVLVTPPAKTVVTGLCVNDGPSMPDVFASECGALTVCTEG